MLWRPSSKEVQPLGKADKKSERKVGRTKRAPRILASQVTEFVRDEFQKP